MINTQINVKNKLLQISYLRYCFRFLKKQYPSFDMTSQNLKLEYKVVNKSFWKELLVKYF